MELSINSIIDVLWQENMYKATIQDMGDSEILISIPVKDGIYLTLNNDTVIENIFYDEKGNVFSYKAKVIGRHIEKDIPFYKLTKPYDIKKIQRRDYVRVNLIQIINYVKEMDLKKEIKKEEEYENALLLDLSGGGMKVKIKEKLEKDDLIIANLKYENEKITIKGKIIRVEKTEDKRFICGVAFVDIDNSTREKIIRTVFKIMRKQRERV